MKYSEDASRQYHIQAAAGEVGHYVLLPGDPKRCAKIAQYFDNPVLIADSREFVTYTGTLDGVKVSVTSTGIGGASAAIAMEELVKCGADTFIRVGTSGGMQPGVKSGDIVIATGAVRMEGTSREYAPIEYPAAADLSVSNALAASARALGCVRGSAFGREDLPGEAGSSGNPAASGGVLSDVPEDAGSLRPASAKNGGFGTACYHIGVVQSKDSFYGQHDPGEMPVSYELENKWEAFKRMGCLASEMESAALFTVAAFRRVRCGACFLVMANQERERLGLPNPVVRDTDLAVRVGIGAVRELIRADQG